MGDFVSYLILRGQTTANCAVFATLKEARPLWPAKVNGRGYAALDRAVHLLFTHTTSARQCGLSIELRAGLGIAAPRIVCSRSNSFNRSRSRQVVDRKDAAAARPVRC